MLRKIQTPRPRTKDKRGVGEACPKCGWITRLSPSPCTHKMEKGMVCLSRHYAWRCDRCKVFYSEDGEAGAGR